MDNKTLHIALVGGQTMPVYLALRESRAGKVILIHSSSTKKEAERIVRDMSPEMADCEFELFELEPLDYFVISEKIENLLDAFRNRTVEVNVSSGTKPWSMAFAMLAYRYENLQIIYVDQNSIIYNYTLFRKHLAAAPDIAGILRYNQTDVKEHRNLEEYTEEDLEQLPKIKAIRDVYNRGKFSIFNTLTNPNKHNSGRYANNIRDTIVDPETSSEISWDKSYYDSGSSCLKQLVRFYFIDKFGNHKEFTIVSPHAFELVTSYGWFEYEVATILRKWPSCNEVWLNTVFPYNNKKAKNEIDVIVQTGHKLLFVECKTQVLDKTDIDKFSSAVKNYGGMGAKALFVTQQYMGTEAEEKCETNKIAHFSFYDRLGRPVSHKALYDLLNQIIKDSNTR